jgi:hypothetical protein
MNRTVTLIPSLLLLVALAGSASAQPHFLVDNFTALFPGNAEMRTESNTADPKVGLASLRLHYAFAAPNRAAGIDFGDDRRPVAGVGTAKVWVKGDASGNDLEIGFREGAVKTEADGRQVFVNRREFSPPRVKLDFAGWKEVDFQLPAPAEGNSLYFQKVVVHPVGNEPKPAGTIELDDLRVYPTASPPDALATIGWIGSDVRELGAPMELFLDARNFTKTPAKVRGRIQLTDRNENMVATREFTLDLAAGGQQEVRWDLAPENLAAFLPPFKVSGDVMSAELPELSARIDSSLVVGNSRYLFDDMGDAAARWFTAGSPKPPRENLGLWYGWTHDESQRASSSLQTSARISRADVAAVGGKPPAKHALQIDYVGDAAVYTGATRYLPGVSYRAGFWVKGDGSKSRLFALFLDFTDGSGRRTFAGEREIATLDFTDWRYVEVSLPGRGRGPTTPQGSTREIDFPLELTALRIEAATPDQKGSIQIGPIDVFTQQPLANARSPSRSPTTIRVTSGSRPPMPRPRSRIPRCISPAR